MDMHSSGLAEEEIADIYRRIGIVLRKHGAFGVYLLSSKTLDRTRLEVEIIADRLDDYDTALDEINAVSDITDCVLYDGESMENYLLLSEAKEDGIRL